MEKRICKKTSILILLCIIMFSQIGCTTASSVAPDAVFDTNVNLTDFGAFSISWPTSWSVIKNKDINETKIGESCFEALSVFDESGNCSRVEIIKTEIADTNNIHKIIKEKNMDALLTKFQQAYGTNISLNDSGFYRIDGNDCFYYEINFTRNENSHVISQTYFIAEQNVYSISVVAINDNDTSNALNIPFSLKFAE